MKSTGFQLFVVGAITGVVLFFVSAAASYNKAALVERLDAVAVSPSAITLIE